MPRSARARRAVLALGLLLVAAVLSACAVGPSTRPPVAVRGSTDQNGVPVLPPPPPPAGPQLPVPDAGDASAAQFIDCTDDMQQVLPVPVPAGRSLRFECTDIPVGSSDSSDGLGRPRQSSIGLMRVSLTDRPPDARPPLLVLGDSGGETGTLRAARLAALLPVAVLQHFSIVGMDRRGEGTSRLDCFPPERRDEVLDAAIAAGDQDAVGRLLEDIRGGVQECNLSEGDALTKYDTATTAQDIEQARALLGVHTLSAVGLGDGAKALAVWAQTFPASVGRVVLDSPPDPTLDSIGQAESEAAAAEAAYTAFGQDCLSRPNCPIGPDPNASLTALANQLKATPLTASDGNDVTGSTALNAVLVGLDNPAEWPRLATAIAAARTGDPSGLQHYLDQLVGLNGRFDLSTATRCNDTTQRVSPPQIAQLIGQWSTAHPLFGAIMAQQLLLCTAWPVPTQPAQLNPAVATPPMLVLGSAVNPREPVRAYQRAAAQLAAGVLVNWQGSGDGAYPATSCVSDAVNQFLDNGVIPPASVLCPP